MNRRVGPEDIKELLSLVERNREVDPVASVQDDTNVPASAPVWSSNHDFWVDQLRHETGGNWPEQQYVDAANLINSAETQRGVLSNFVQVLTRHDNENTETFDGNSSADQIVLREEFRFSTDDNETSEGSSSPRVSQTSNDQPLGNEADNQKNPAAANTAGGREPSGPVINQIRADLYVQTGLASLQPYTSWDDFQSRNHLPRDLVADLESAYPEGIDALDLWVAGLAEANASGLAGSTLQALIDAGSSPRVKTTDTIAPGPADATGDTVLPSDAMPFQVHSGTPQLARAVAPDLNVLNQTTADNAASSTSGQTILGTARDDLIKGTGGNDLVLAGAGDDVAFGGSGDDHIEGGRGRDTLHGNTGRDNIRGGSGSDTIHGGDGDDILEGGSGADVLHGGDGTDVASGGTGNDHLFGNSGTDVLDGGIGADFMAGGMGDDTIYIDDSGDAAVEAFDEGSDTVYTTLNVYILPDNVEILVFIGDENAIGTGNDLANAMTAGAGNDELHGLGGDDILTGGDGDDTLVGGDGINILIAGLGSDVIVISSSHDVVVENRGEGIDTVLTSLNSHALSENVEILVFTGSGDFTGFGNELDNVITGGNLNDVIIGGAGNDVIHGGQGNDQLYGGDGDDQLHGGDGDNYLDGGAGNDVVLNDQGNDYILFTRGNDTLVLRPGFGNDVVIGFDTNSKGSGGRDRIDVSAYGFEENALGIDILLVYDGDSTVLRIGADNVKLTFVNVNTLDRHDFIF